MREPSKKNIIIIVHSRIGIGRKVFPLPFYWFHVDKIFRIDAPDFYHGSIFDSNPTSGLGGWGNPDDDYQITTGGFSGDDFVLAYPSPHKIRRNFTLQPFLGLTVPPGAPPFKTSEMINVTFTEENNNFMLDSFVGDFEGFQAYFEGLAVFSLATALADILKRCTLQGPHGGPHLILGA